VEDGALAAIFDAMWCETVEGGARAVHNGASDSCI